MKLVFTLLSLMITPSASCLKWHVSVLLGRIGITLAGEKLQSGDDHLAAVCRVDHVVLRLAAGTEDRGALADLLRVHVVDVAGLRRLELILDRRLRQQTDIVQHGRVAALGRDPALHLLEGATGGNGLLRLLRGLFDGPAVAQVEHIGRQPEHQR